MKNLTADHFEEMRTLLRNPKNATSSRHRDGLRRKLKSLGMIRFDRSLWQWEVLPAGHAALKEEKAIQ